MHPDPSWDGIIAAVVALFAVLGATVVGFRQIGISKAVADAQAERHSDDIALRKQTLQLALLEKRQDCIASFRTIWSEYIRSGQLSEDEIESLKRVLWDAKLVFPEAISKDIGEVVSSSHLANYFSHKFEERNSRGKYDESLLDRAFSYEDETSSRMPNLLDRMEMASRVVELKS